MFNKYTKHPLIRDCFHLEVFSKLLVRRSSLCSHRNRTNKNRVAKIYSRKGWPYYAQRLLNLLLAGKQLGDRKNTRI